jgi:hypothetical protein
MKAIKGIMAVFMIMLLSLTTVVVADDYNTADREASARSLSQVPLEVLFVEVNGDQVEDTENIREGLDRDDKIDIRVKLQTVNPGQKVEDVWVEAEIIGDEHHESRDREGPINFVPDNQDPVSGDLVKETVDLELDIPADFETGNYQLRVTVSDRDRQIKAFDYSLLLETARHSLTIKNFDLYPTQEVKAGSVVIGTLRLYNLGQKDEHDVRALISIPELGLSSLPDEIDEVEVEEKETTEELVLRLPRDTAPGTYEVVAEVFFDDDYKKAVSKKTITVVGSAAMAPSNEGNVGGVTRISIAPDTQSVVAGQSGAVYQVTVENTGVSSKSYAIGVSGVTSFGSSEVSPSNVVVVSPGQTETAFVYVSANQQATAGPHSFTIDIKDSNGKVLQQVPLTADVTEATVAGWDKAKKSLEVGLIVLIVILIILGLIFAFNKAKEREDEETSQTYY